MAFHRLLGLLANVSTSLQLKVRIWNALVRPVLLYRCGTWGLMATLTEKLCPFHRRHLWTMAGYRWPNRINNEALYKLTRTHTLSVDLQLARLTLLGHCLRSPITSSAQAALDLSVGADIDLKPQKGRPKQGLLSTLRQDVQKAGLSLRSSNVLQELHSITSNGRWEETIEHICST